VTSVALGCPHLLLLFALYLASQSASSAFLTVDTTADVFNRVDQSGDCSLREAINRINVGSNGRGCVDSSADGYGTDDQIVVPSGQYDLTRSGTWNDNGDLDLLKDVAFHGSGASATHVIQSVGNNERVFELASGVTVYFNDMTVSGGTANVDFAGAGIQVGSGASATLIRCQVTGNTGSGSAAGGIGNNGSLTLNDSTISGNSNSRGTVGAGVDNNGGSVSVTNSTISGNGGSGPGLYAYQGSLSVISATFDGNGTDYVGEGSGSRSFSNTILNSGCGGVSFSDQGFNRDAGSSCSLSSATSQPNTSVSLGSLTNNGGGTQTQLPILTATPTQAAIDVIPPGSSGCGGSLNLDQRRAPRPVDGGTGVVNCDIGAVELNSIPTVAVVSGVKAEAGETGVVLRWKTVSEVDTVGFHVERQSRDGESYTRVTDSLLLSPGVPQGSAYRVTDTTASTSGTHRYRLVEVETDGDRRTHGPFDVTINTREAAEDPGPEVRDPAPERGNLAGLRYRVDAPDSAIPRPVSRGQRVRTLARKSAHLSLINAGTAATGSAIRIAVTGDGLYFVSAGDIETTLGLAAGSARSLIADGGLRLTTRGEESAWLPAVNGAGLYFYATAIDSPYTRDNIYWLTRGDGLIVGVEPGVAPPAPVAPGSFTDVVHIEQDGFTAPPVASDPESDYWYWALLIEGHETEGEVTLDLPLAGVAPGGGEGRIVLHMQGVTYNEHAVTVSLNGTQVGEGRWSGQVPESLELAFDQVSLVEGVNQLTLTGLGTSDAGLHTLYVDSVDVEYRRRYAAVQDALEFHGDGNATVSVSGFGDANVSVLNISDPLRPRLCSGSRVVPTAGGYAVSFVPNPTDASWFAVSSGGVRAPTGMTAATPESIPEVTASYVVIAPQRLFDGAQRLADYRQGTGVDSVAIKLESLYDAYNAGIPHPSAIREFLAEMYDRSGGTYPRNVVLLGDGSLDYRNLEGHEDSQVPSLLVPTDDGLFASDLQYGDRNGDGIPEFIVSRIPVETDAGIQSYIEKLTRHEASAPGTKQHIGLLADDPDSAGRFPEDSDELARLLPAATSPWRIYMSDHSLPEARSALFRRLTDGTGILNYLGHGGLDRLQEDGLLTSDDVPDLAPQPRLPVLLALTCVINRFEVPGFDSLGEELILSPQGAIAVLAPSGFSVNDRARRLNAALFRSIYDADAGTLGEAVLEAMRDYGATGDGIDMLLVYNLLGDGSVSLK